MRLSQQKFISSKINIFQKGPASKPNIVKKKDYVILRHKVAHGNKENITVESSTDEDLDEPVLSEKKNIFSRVQNLFKTNEAKKNIELKNKRKPRPVPKKSQTQG